MSIIRGHRLRRGGPTLRGNVAGHHRVGDRTAGSRIQPHQLGDQRQGRSIVAMERLIGVGRQRRGGLLKGLRPQLGEPIDEEAHQRRVRCARG